MFPTIMITDYRVFPVMLALDTTTQRGVIGS